MVYQDELEGTVHVSDAVADAITPEGYYVDVQVYLSVDKVIQHWRVWKSARDLHGNLPRHAYNKPIIDTMVYGLGLG